MDSVSPNTAPAFERTYHYPSGGLSPTNLLRALETIQASEERVTVKDLAASIPMSAFHFARAFKISTGLPPHRFMLHRRIDRAKRLLAETDKPVAGIARELGFKTPSHFASVFRAIAGMSPRHYRVGVNG